MSPNFDLDPGVLKSSSIKFDPSTINTTSSMIVSITPNNIIPANTASVTIRLPLKWVNDNANAPYINTGTSLICSVKTGVPTACTASWS